MIQRIFFTCSFILVLNYARCQGVSKEEIDSFYKILIEMTDAALKAKNFDKVVIYCNTFNSASEIFESEQKYKDYFLKVFVMNQQFLAEWVISMNAKPTKYVGGFVNIEKLTVEQLKKLEHDIKLFYKKD